MTVLFNVENKNPKDKTNKVLHSESKSESRKRRISLKDSIIKTFSVKPTRYNQNFLTMKSKGKKSTYIAV